MSPTVFRERGFRFLFFSREEPRIHVHVQCAYGEVKFWIEPSVTLAKSKGLSAADLRTVEEIIRDLKMKSESLGKVTLEVEVTNISRLGLWLLADEEELFLPFDEFPWFKEASVSAVLNVERQGKEHLYWPTLDVDLTLESIRHPEPYPRVSGVGAQQSPTPESSQE
jgi:hypothetical protein